LVPYLLCIACGLFLVSAVYRLRVRQIAAGINARFDERLAERTRIAQELHDTLLQGFLSASMQVHVAADRLPADSQVKPILTRALELMGQVIEEGRNAVRGLRSSHSVSLDLEQAFAEFSRSSTPKKAPTERKSDSASSRKVSEGPAPSASRRSLPDRPGGADQRISPRASESDRGRAEIQLESASLLVRDDGCGIDPTFCGRAGTDTGDCPECAKGRIALEPGSGLQQRLGGHRS
jgi:hypothetical protein